MYLFNHLKLVYTHRKYVRKNCFNMGLVKQGLLHDLSKYSPAELSICKYYNGKRSPHQNARDALGYSPCWINHYHRNKHHFQYWWDETEDGEIIPIKMPYKYVVESFCDMLGASKAYNKDNWNPHLLTSYWENKCVGKRIMHYESESLVEKLIYKLDELGEVEFFEWYKKNKKQIESDYAGN